MMMEVLNRIIKMIYVLPMDDVTVLALLFSLFWGLLARAWFKKTFWRIINILGAVCSIAVILFGTLYTRTSHVREVFLIPFQTFEAAKHQRELYRTMFMNVIFFLPLGLTLPFALPRKWRWPGRIVVTVLFGLCLSVGVEFCQYYFALGRSEIDDVIMNTFGALLGSLLVGLCAIKKRQRT